MAVYMFRVCVGLGPMSKSDLQSRMNKWVDKNADWADDSSDRQFTEATQENSDTVYQIADARFEKQDTKDNLLQKFTDKLKDKVDWYRVGYHNCSHDEDPPQGCTWDDQDEWTAKNVTIPSGVPEFV